MRKVLMSSSVLAAITIVLIAPRSLQAGHANPSSVEPQGIAVQQRPIIDGWRWVDEEPKGTAQWLGLRPDIDALFLVYQLVLNDQSLTGRLGVSQVELEKSEGVWSGRFGGQLISEARVASRENGRTIVEVTSSGLEVPPGPPGVGVVAEAAAVVLAAAADFSPGPEFSPGPVLLETHNSNQQPS